MRWRAKFSAAANGGDAKFPPRSGWSFQLAGVRQASGLVLGLGADNIRQPERSARQTQAGGLRHYCGRVTPKGHQSKVQFISIAVLSRFKYSARGISTAPNIRVAGVTI